MTRRSRRFSALFQCVVLLLPWPLRRRLLTGVLGFDLAKGSRIGIAVVDARDVHLGEGAWIGHLTVVKGLSRLRLDRCAILGKLNWVTAHPAETTTFFGHRPGRDPSLEIGPHAAITNRHLIDCSDRITVGAFSTVAGWGSQLLTHSIDLRTSRQDCAPLDIGCYCFVGTRVIILPGASLGDYNVVGAGSVLTSPVTAQRSLVRGNPAVVVGPYPRSGDALYFRRETGYVH